MNKLASLVAIALCITGCSDTSGVDVDASVATKFQAFPTLPTSTSQSIEVTGAMTWWFWEGDGGCFGTLTDGRQNLELHAEADLCEPIDYEEGQEATITVTFDPDKQYSPNDEKMYSIIEFIK